MKRFFLFLYIPVLYSGGLHAGTFADGILQAIENNNIALKVARQSAEVQKAEARTGIYPNDINVEYEKVFGNEASAYQRESELTVSQSFDFPSAYIQKKKIANVKSEKADIQYKALRRDILLEAKLICLELVYYNKQKEIISGRLQNAEKLNELYSRKLQLSDATIIEANKIALEFANMQNEYRLINIEINSRQQRLTEMNGNEPIFFTATAYGQDEDGYNYEDLLGRYWEENPEMVALEKEQEIAAKSIGLARSMSLPKFNIGYKRNISNPEKYNGFVAGMSIPLWENKNAVRKAKAGWVLANLEIENIRSIRSSEYKQLYNRAFSLLQSIKDYQRLLESQNNREYLDKALEAGQITLLEYLMEINFLYQSTENYLLIEKDYHITMAELYKFQL